MLICICVLIHNKIRILFQCVWEGNFHELFAYFHYKDNKKGNKPNKIRILI